MATGAASLIANAATRSAIEGSSFGDNISRGLPDAVGQIVGGALGSAAHEVLAKARASGNTNNGSASSGPVASGGQTVGEAAEDIVVNQSAIRQALDNMSASFSALTPENRISVAANLGQISSATAASLQARILDIKSAARDGYLASRGVIENRYVDLEAGGFVIDHGTLAARKEATTNFFNADPGHPDKPLALAALQLNGRLIDQWDSVAHAEINKLAFAGIGGPALLAGGAVLAPVAGAYATSLFGTSVSGGTGAATFYGTSFVIGGSAGGAFEYSKNELFGLDHTPGGYVGSILGGGIGGTGWQVLSRGAAPALLNNIATGGVLGGGGDVVGQLVDGNP